MALTILVAKKQVNLIQPNLYSVVLNLNVKDGTIEVVNKDFPIEYRTGDSVPPLYNIILTQMQDEINKYKAEQVIFTAPQLDTVVTNLNTNLVG